MNNAPEENDSAVGKDTSDNEEKYRLLAENSIDCIWQMDAALTFRYLSPSLYDILGFYPEEWIGTTIFKHASWRQSFRMARYALHALKNYKTFKYIVFETHMPNKQGQEVPLEIRGRILFSKHGLPVGLQGTTRDISDRKQAEAVREKLIKDLEQRNAEMEQIAYAFSHDLKTPLVTIESFLNLLKREFFQGNDHNFDDYTARIANAAKKMHQLLDGLLELSYAGITVTERQPIDLIELIAEAQAILEIPIGFTKARIEVDQNIPLIYGDRNQWLRVIVNLLDNAVKFRNPAVPPHIRIRFHNNGGQGVVCIEDNGIGIRKEYSEKIFALFHKLDRGSEGNGIGLTIVKRIIELHGGKIWVVPNAGGTGSSFCFTVQTHPVH
ncbi:MAG: ATP-binding protein [Candidatus Auribacterota bacterium]